MTKPLRLLAALAVATGCAASINEREDQAPAAEPKSAASSPAARTESSAADQEALRQAEAAAAQLRNTPRTMERLVASMSPKQRAALEHMAITLAKPTTDPARAAAEPKPAKP